MGFFFTGIWGLIYLLALVLAGIVTLAGNVKAERRILYVMVVNWLCVRSIVYFNDYNAYTFLTLSILTFIALAVYARTSAAKVCAGLFFLIAQLDILTNAQVMTFQQSAEIQDAIGFLILIIMAGAAHDIWRTRRPTIHVWPSRMRPVAVGIHARDKPDNAAGVALAQDMGQEN